MAKVQALSLNGGICHKSEYSSVVALQYYDLCGMFLYMI